MARSIPARLAAAGIVCLPGALTVYLAFNAGGFFAGTPGLLVMLLGLALVLQVTLADRPFDGLHEPVLVAAAGLGLFALWALLSFAWSDAPARAMIEFNRGLLYLFTVVLMALTVGSPARLAWVVRLLALAITAVLTVAVISRTLPEVWPTGANWVDDRLSYPITYWNATGLLAALGMVLCLHLASHEREPLAIRAAGAAALPVLGTALVLTYSRGAMAVAALALVGYALAARPRGLAAGLLATVPATGVAVVVAYSAEILGTTRFDLPAGVEEGREVALVVAACAIGAALVRLALVPLDRRLTRWEPGPVSPRRALAAGAVVVALGLAGALAAGLPGELSRQYDRFVSGDLVEGSESGQAARLTDVGNNGRLEEWELALDAFGRDSLIGNGAGTFALIWDRDRSEVFEVHDGHSLYLETLAELGLIGLVLLGVVLVTVLGGLAVRARGPDRPLYAAVAVVALAWALHAAIDWDWEMPVVTLPFWALAGAALGVSRAQATGWRPGRGARVAFSLGLVALCLAPGMMAISQWRLDDSVDAFRAGDCARSVDAALDSIRAVGVRPEPFQMLAFCDVRFGLEPLAVEMMEKAVDRDPDNWEMHYSLALVRGAARLDPRPAARRALALNPLGELPRQAVRRFRGSDPARWEVRARRSRLPLQ